MAEPGPSPAPASQLRHWGGFALGGVLALTTDATILIALTGLAGLSPFIARLFAIAVAMVVSWLVNRTLTFAMTGAPTLAEFARFAAVSWGAQAVNYLVFVSILVLRPHTHPIGALVVASLFATAFSYTGFRYGVFRRGGVAEPNSEQSR